MSEDGQQPCSLFRTDLMTQLFQTKEGRLPERRVADLPHQCSLQRYTQTCNTLSACEQYSRPGEASPKRRFPLKEGSIQKCINRMEKVNNSSKVKYWK